MNKWFKRPASLEVHMQISPKQPTVNIDNLNEKIIVTTTFILLIVLNTSHIGYIGFYECILLTMCVAYPYICVWLLLVLLCVWAFVPMHACVGYTHAHECAQYLCSFVCVSVDVCGIVSTVCVPVCFQEFILSGLEPAASSQPLSPHKTKQKLGLFIVLPALFFFWLLSKFPLSSLGYSSSIHSTPLCYYLLPVVFSLDRMRALSKGLLKNEAKLRAVKYSV